MPYIYNQFIHKSDVLEYFSNKYALKWRVDFVVLENKVKQLEKLWEDIFNEHS